MADVFLSYKREDRARAREIADGIEKHGFEVFFDAEIDVGEAFDERIEREIAAAKCVVVLWSEKSASAKWVKREARVGAEREHLAPAIIGACTIPLEFSEIQAADLRAWRGDPSAPEWVQFISRITECTQKPAKKLPAMPWKRRWVRVAAGLVVGVGVAGGGAYLLRDKIVPPPAPTTTATSTTTQVQATSLPADVFQMLNWSISAGDCEGLQQDINAVRDEYPSISRVEAAMVRECRRRAPQVAQQTTSTTAAPQNQGKQAAPPSQQQQRPSQTTTTATTRSLPVAGYLASLVARDRTPISQADVEGIATRFGAEPDAVWAVIDVMSGRSGSFGPDGRPIILFEPHIFSRRTEHRFDATNPRVSYPTWNAAGYPRTQEGRWEQLREAYALDPEAALAATSWGRFQILGQNYAAAGFSSPSEFVSFISQSQSNEARAFEAFIRSNGLADELQRKDWEGFARGYNGPGQIERYGSLLRQAYERRHAGGG